MAFLTTRWSLVWRAASPGPAGHLALAELCEIYWPSVHAFYRSAVRDRERARDLTQGLFARLLERGDFATAVPERGRFRHWLCTCARHHLASDYEAAVAQKRGGGAGLLSLSLEQEERELANEPIDPEATPEQAFAQRWVRSVIDRAVFCAGVECRERGRDRVFALAKQCLLEDAPRESFAVLAERLGMTEGAFKVAVHRLRERVRELIVDEVRQTLSDPGDEADEIAFLLGELASRKSRVGP